MPVAETLQPEAGDDRNKDAEIARLNEIYYGPEVVQKQPDIGPGDIILQPVGRATGALLLRRANISLQR